jgi:ferredoxin
VKIVVDQNLCSGHARCAATTPDLYELDDDGFCALTELVVAPGSEKNAQAGADACPERAITVHH